MKITNITRKRVLCEKVEIAESFLKKTKGLMFREFIPKRTGFLMVFPQESRTGIWMLGMRFALDIVFLDSEKRIVDIKKNVKPMSFKPSTWKVYYPRKKSRYILEINSGESANLKKGDMLRF